MPWGMNGVQTKRIVRDQAPIVPAWGATQANVGTQQLTQVGYLDELDIIIPNQSGTVTYIAAGNSLAAQANAQRPAGRAINSFSVNVQGIVPLWNLLGPYAGIDIEMLEYVGNGKPKWADPGLGLAPDIAPASSLGALGRPAASLAAIAYHVAAASTSGTAPNISQNVQYSGHFQVPMTEIVAFPEYTMQSGGKTVTVPAQEVQVGLITLQNSAAAVQPRMLLNPLYSGGTDSPFLQTGTAPAGSLSTVVEFWARFYDVPDGAANQPPGYSQLYVVTRQTADDGVASGGVKHTFTPAGMLLRSLYTFYDANDNLVDVSTQSIQAIGTYPLPAAVPEATISFAWGSTIYKYYQQRVSGNLKDCLERYGEPPPQGLAVHDFFRDRTLTDIINTAILPNVRCELAGLPASVVKLHTIEERMIPVQDATA